MRLCVVMTFLPVVMAFTSNHNISTCGGDVVSIFADDVFRPSSGNFFTDAATLCRAYFHLDDSHSL